MNPVLTGVAGLALLLALTASATAEAKRAAKNKYDCPDARSLPKDADDESRRITCEIPAKYRQDVSRAEFMGRLIRLHDMAAWLTTDALVAIDAFKDVDAGAARGWLTEARDDGVVVRYFAAEDGRVEAIASARLARKPIKATDAKILTPREAMTAREERLMRAKDLVLKSGEWGVCTEHPPNTVLFEFEEDGKPEILVFVMSSWVNEQAPLGGFHMFRVSDDGARIVDHFSQTKGCMKADGTKLDTVGSLMVSHLNSAAPTMFHVFMSLQYRKPMFVSTTQNDLLWRVDNGQISLATPNAAPSSPATAETQGGPANEQGHSTP